MADGLSGGIYVNSGLISTTKTAHTNAETAGVTFNTSGTVTPTGNATTWSRASARAAYAAGSITVGQFNSVMGALATYEQTQVDAARDVLRGGAAL